MVGEVSAVASELFDLLQEAADRKRTQAAKYRLAGRKPGQGYMLSGCNVLESWCLQDAAVFEAHAMDLWGVE